MTMITALFLAAALAFNPPVDSLLVVDWNLENFYDFRDDGTSASDHDFSPAGEKHWTGKRFYRKCNAVAKTILYAASLHGRIPDVICLEEIENGFVLNRLRGSTLLRKLDYRTVHFDSPDHRGIDCGLLYRESRLKLVSAEPKHLYDPAGAVMGTRDILLAQFLSGSDSIAVLVNHHPSKVGGSSDGRRRTAMDRMWSICDSLKAVHWGRIICVGDFNDDLWGAEHGGTIKYNGSWQKIDGCFSCGLEVVESVLTPPWLLEPDRAFGGMKPRRTYIGPRYNGGVSDHLPIVLGLYPLFDIFVNL